MFKAKNLLIIVLIVSVMTTVWFINNQKQNIIEINEQREVDPGVRITNPQLIGRHQGKRQWEIISETITQKGEMVYIDGIEKVTIMRDEEPFYFLTAESGEWNRDTGVLVLVGEIVITDNNGFSLITDQLIWNGNREIEIPNRFTMTVDDSDIVADRVFIDINKEIAHVIGNVAIKNDKFTWVLDHFVYEFDSEILQILGGITINFERR